VFCGTFTAGGLEIAVDDGQLKILREGRITKFVDCVEQLSFSARRSREIGQEVLYVTERAVFRLGPERLELIELAPGMYLQEHVLRFMPNPPIVERVNPMPAHVFALPRG
ncbi:MAG: hypothetical protein JW888_12390, partial [Pirellulales bacterium]|nr:hypothetical protein [Pirellulales bacterium]